MRIILVLSFFLSCVSSADELTPPKLEHCTLDSNLEVYLCMQTLVGDETYLAVFAHDGLAAIRIAEIKKNGKQDVVFPPWTGCSFFKTCVIKKIGHN